MTVKMTNKTKAQLIKELRLIGEKNDRLYAHSQSLIKRLTEMRKEKLGSLEKKYEALYKENQSLINELALARQQKTEALNKADVNIGILQRKIARRTRMYIGVSEAFREVLEAVEPAPPEMGEGYQEDW